MSELSTTDALAQVSFLLQATLERRAAEAGGSLIQARLLGILRDRRPTMAELARLLDLDKSSVTGLVDRAARRGLLERVPSPTDGRSFLVVLSDGGRELVDQIAARFSDDVDALLAPLADGDRTELAALLTRVLAGYAHRHGVELFPGGG